MDLVTFVPDKFQPSETRFLWEGLRLLAEFSGKRAQVYTYSDQTSYAPLARIDGTGEGSKVYYFHNQVNGQPELMTDSEGKECWRAEPDCWGKVTGETDPREITTGGPQNLRMQGQYLDRETGLHYNLYRYYDPDNGRFTQQDPIGLLGGLNLYQYAPNALGWVDPWGLSCGKPNHKAGMSTKKYGHARNRHGSQNSPQSMKDRAKTTGNPQGHFSDNATIEEAFGKSPTTPGAHDVNVSKSSNVYYPDGTSKSTDVVKVIISETKGPVTAYPYILGD